MYFLTIIPTFHTLDRNPSDFRSDVKSLGHVKNCPNASLATKTTAQVLDSREADLGLVGKSTVSKFSDFHETR